MVLYLEPSQPRRVGEAGKKTPIFPAGKVAIWIAERSIARQIYGCFEMVLSPEAKQKQTYGCFEMVSPTRKQLYYNRASEV